MNPIDETNFIIITRHLIEKSVLIGKNGIKGTGDKLKEIINNMVQEETKYCQTTLTSIPNCNVTDDILNLIKTRFFVNQIIYNPLNGKNGLILEKDCYEKYQVKKLNISISNQGVILDSIRVKHCIKNGNGRIEEFYSHTGQLDDLFIELPQNYKSIS